MKAGKKEYLAEWISQFDEQIRFEYSKQLEEIIKKSSQELQEKYGKSDVNIILKNHDQLTDDLLEFVYDTLECYEKYI